MAWLVIDHDDADNNDKGMENKELVDEGLPWGGVGQFSTIEEGEKATKDVISFT
jgi:hypothetical protein